MSKSAASGMTFFNYWLTILMSKNPLNGEVFAFLLQSSIEGNLNASASHILPTVLCMLVTNFECSFTESLVVPSRMDPNILSCVVEARGIAVLVSL
jgi:hypothetical protein